MSQEKQRGIIQRSIVNIGTKKIMNCPVKSTNTRRNNNNSKINNSSNSENTTRSRVITDQNSSNEQPIQDPAEDNEKKAAKIVYTIPIMLELSNLPMSLIEPECLKNFEKMRIRRPDVGILSNIQETLPRQIGFNLEQCRNGNSTFYNNEPRGMSNCARDKYTNSNHYYTNNTRAQHYRTNSRNPHHDGDLQEHNQHYNFYNDTYINKNIQSSVMETNRFDINRRSQNPGSYNNYSRYYNNDNIGSRDNGHNYNNSYYDTDGFQRNNIPERETIHSNFKQRRVIHYSLMENSIVELNTCENAWVPSCRDSQKSTKTNEAEIEEIQKKFRSILNKITPETMVILTKSIIDLHITTYKNLSKIIELLFQKAIDEPNFTPQYAYICSQMKDIQVTSDDDKIKTSFKQLIVLKCQKTFELVSVLEENAVNNLSEIEYCKDQVLKKKLQFNYDENERIQRKRSVGNCRFMCEMFKVKLLNSDVLEMCVRHLLKFPKEEPLECLCNILKHIGQYLNPEKTFEKLQEISSKSYKTKISSRIRFMILDTIELKNNNWVPRNIVIKPKMLNEIEEDFTMVSTNNRTVSAYTQPFVRSSENYLDSNAQKDHLKSFNSQMESEACFNLLQNEINEQETFNTNPENMKIESDVLTKNNEVQLNTCKNAWVPRFRNLQNSIVSREVNVEDKINKEKTINSSFENKKIEPESVTKNSEVALNTCENSWVPRFRNTQKLTATSEVKIEYKINEENTINSNLEGENIEAESNMKNDKVQPNTCKNPWIPRFRNSHKLTGTNKLEIEEIETKDQKLLKRDISMELITDVEQDSFETFYSDVNSMIPENIISSTNQQMPHISSIDVIEEIIDVFFKRAITEPNTSLIVEMCILLKEIVLSTDNGSMHVFFEKQLATRCRKLLQMEVLEHHLETKTPIMSTKIYTLIGELYNKKLLHLNVLVEFIKSIPNRLTDASIGNICHLLKIIGAEIESSYHLRPIIKHLETYVNNDAKGLISPINKDVVMDLLKLHNNKWIPMNIIDSPATIMKTDQNVSHSLIEILRRSLKNVISMVKTGVHILTNDWVQTCWTNILSVCGETYFHFTQIIRNIFLS